MAVKLLILEDSELDAELMFREIKQMEQEFSTKLVSTKNDFEQSLINWHPDIVISDFDLQTFSGDETLILAKKLKPGIPVIILSGGISKEQEVYLLENRANDVLTKDNLKRLPFVINRLLNEKRDKEKLNNTLYELAGNLEFQEALAEISLGFNSFDSFDEKVNNALTVLGKTADVSRAYIFEEFEDGKAAKNTYEWCAPGVTPEIENMQNLRYKEEMPSLKPILLNKGRLYAKDIQSLPADIIKVLDAQDIKALMVYPITLGDKFFGFIGFDEVREKREWNRSEDKLLKSVSGIIGNAFSEYQSELALKKTNIQLNKLLAEKELLVGEVHHRVKNNLALISSFLQLDQMGLGIKGQDDIISANILRVKSIAIIHEIIYELGTFTDISVVKTLKKVIEESFIQERIQDIEIEISSSNKDIKFNINQAVPFSLLISEMIFEVFRFPGDIKFSPNKKLKIGIFQDDVNICIYFFDKELTRVIDIYNDRSQHKFSEIFNVLAKQISATIETDAKKESVKIEFEYREVKGASSALI